MRCHFMIYGEVSEAYPESLASVKIWTGVWWSGTARYFELRRMSWIFCNIIVHNFFSKLS